MKGTRVPRNSWQFECLEQALDADHMVAETAILQAKLREKLAVVAAPEDDRAAQRSAAFAAARAGDVSS